LHARHHGACGTGEAANPADDIATPAAHPCALSCRRAALTVRTRRCTDRVEWVVHLLLLLVVSDPSESELLLSAQSIRIRLPILIRSCAVGRIHQTRHRAWASLHTPLRQHALPDCDRILSCPRDVGFVEFKLRPVELV